MHNGLASNLDLPDFRPEPNFSATAQSLEIGDKVFFLAFTLDHQVNKSPVNIGLPALISWRVNRFGSKVGQIEV